MSTHNFSSITSRLALVAAISSLCFASSPASAGLASVPLSVANSVEPNILLVLDDSGSMDWEMIFNTDSSQLKIDDIDIGDAERATPIGTDGNYLTSQGTEYSYLFPISYGGGNSGNRIYKYDNGNGRALPPRPEYAFARSSEYNGQFYDPMVTYTPWVKADGDLYPNAVATAALADPAKSTSVALDLTGVGFKDYNDANWSFYRANDMRSADGNGGPGDEYNSDGDGYRNQYYSYVPATYYMRITDNIGLPSWIDDFGNNCNNGDYKRYLQFLDDWSNDNQAKLEAVGVDAIGTDGACLKKYEITTDTSFPSGRSQGAELQNFANWFSYYRKRHLTLRSALGKAFLDKSGLQIGAFEINHRSDEIGMLSLSTQKETLYKWFYEQLAESNGTPNRAGLLRAGELFDSTDHDFIKYACQQNFALQFTDGYNNSYADGAADGADNNEGVPYQDSKSDTLGDIAMYYYKKRLRENDLNAGKVPVRAECSTATPPPSMDCNTDLHMNTYTISFGAQGYLSADYDEVSDAYDNPPTWWPSGVGSTDSGREQADDLYHAAVNGRGESFSAMNSTELSNKLSDALKAILGNVISSASVVSSNSTRLDTSTVLYQAQFDSKDWSGRLLKIKINPDGTIGSVDADAADEMPAAGSRKIYFKGGAFEWANLGSYQSKFSVNSVGDADSYGEQRVAWIRGDQSFEKQNGGELRDRNYILGDIVESSPTFVGGQYYGYDRLPAAEGGGNTYRNFVLTNEITRSKVVYVGANDGMLHAFDANTLKEKFAYIPTEHLENGQLARLPDPTYSHRYFVDGTPISADVYLGSWKTYLVGTLGAGGHTVYGLDISNPDSFSSSDIKWEVEMPGYVVGRPSVAKMQNGSWGVMVSSGYESGTSSMLYILDVADGSVIKKFDLGSTAVGNGLSSPFPVDIDADAVTDYIFAGDLDGNMWKFDVSDSNKSNWTIAYGGDPIFTACAGQDASGYGCPVSKRQPITMRPVVGRGPNNVGVMVYFGTGSYIFTGDSAVDYSNDPSQSFYAIHDKNESSATQVKRSELTKQTITSESGGFRTVSSTEGDPDAKGWYLDLVGSGGFAGERSVSDPLLRRDRLIFPTLIPNTDPCEGGGMSWLMEVDAKTGHAINPPVFDVDGDGDIDANDVINGEPPAGINPDIGIIDTPNVIEGEDTGDEDLKCVAGSTGKITCIKERTDDVKGRNSWRNIWPPN